MLHKACAPPPLLNSVCGSTPQRLGENLCVCEFGGGVVSPLSGLGEIQWMGSSWHISQILELRRKALLAMGSSEGTQTWDSSTFTMSPPWGSPTCHGECGGKTRTHTHTHTHTHTPAALVWAAVDSRADSVFY